MKRFERLISIFLVAVIIILEGTNIANAVDIGGDADVTLINYQVIRDANYNMTSAVIEFSGTNLENQIVYFSTNEGTKKLGTKTIDENSLLQYTLTPVEVDTFTGYVTIGNTGFDLEIGKFPTLNSDTTKIVNIESGSTSGELVISGENLDKLTGTSGIRGEYGKSGEYEEIINSNPSNSNTITISNATPPGSKGLQDIRIIKITDANASAPGIKIEYNYNDVFNFIGEIDVDDVEMYPNIGIKGDNVYFRSSDFKKEYDVYFFETLDGTESFSERNKAIFRGFNPVTTENPEALLTVEVPQGLDLGSHYVVLAETINNQVVAQKVLKSGEDNIIYTLVGASNRPSITSVNPSKGPDIGGTPVGIQGNNLLSSSIPGLDIDYSPDNPEDISFDFLESSKKEIIAVYKDATYQDVTATATRRLSVQIGDKANFQENPNVAGEPRVEIGAKDSIYVITPKIDDANENPQKEILIEITTVITVSGKEYTFQERATWDYFTYEASSIVPKIESVSPSMVQVLGGKIKSDTLISVTGENFLVNRYIDDEGNTIVNYPRILIKTANDYDVSNYEIMIKIVDGEAKAYYRDALGNEQELNGEAEILVFDDADRKIDGTVGREIGTRLLVKLPEGLPITTGVKNIQITNPTRGSDFAGESEIKIDAIEFVETDDNPIIDKVEPYIVPVDGGEEIIVTGSNFLEGVEVYIDGELVPNVDREVDPAGNKFNLRFTAPKGRAGLTQLLVINPSGGNDTADFIYVETLGKDPKITSFSPNKGGKDTLVFIKGENFLKSNPTTQDISGIGIYNLIGTRILFNNVDINEYYTENGDIALQPYHSSVGPLVEAGESGVNLSDYYHSIILKDTDSANIDYYTFDIDAKDNIILSNGITNTFSDFRKGESDNKFVATKNGAEYSIELQLGDENNGDKIVITKGAETITLEVMTLYAVKNGEITGNRVKILNSSEIIFNVPQKDVENWYDLSVVNPDTKSDIREDGFYYFKQPKKNPTITAVVPSQGSTDGGYAVDIIGSGFEDNSVDKSIVVIGGVQVPREDIIVSTDQTRITIKKMPKYPGDLKTESDDGRKTLPIVVVNSDGGNTYKEDGFTYVVPTSNPKIHRIEPGEGNAAGGIIVRIFGSDFRFFEPYENINGEKEYEDINGDGEWTDLEGMKIGDLSDEDKLILPTVYFGDNKADIIEFADGYLAVELPKSEVKSAVDVIVVNNNFGISNTVKFTYRASAPKINSIIDDIGKKQGRDKIEINGVEFKEDKIEIYTEGTDLAGTQNINIVDMPLVHFGDVSDLKISNRFIPVNHPSGQDGIIVNGKVNVNVGGLNVAYDSTYGNTDVILSIGEGEEAYIFEIEGYDDTVKYIDISSLKDSDGNAYAVAYEMIRLEVDRYNRKLIVERGYAPYHEDINFSEEQLIIFTPSYYTIGIVPVTVTNPDGGNAKSKFTYMNPDSNPQIENITKDSNDAIVETIDGKEQRIHRVSYKGGNVISIIGSDFRDNVTIQVGDILTITEEELDTWSPTVLTFTMPELSEDLVGGKYRIVVTNEDGASVTSDSLDVPIYIEVTKGESVPIIESITPGKGPSKGGTTVTIIGRDFRETMDGFSGRIAVYFGETKVPDEDVEVIINEFGTKTITAVIPPHEPGKVIVRVENPDGENSQEQIEFTYTSFPIINSVVDPLDPSETTIIETISIIGGETIKIKGSQFLGEGTRVVFAPVLKKADINDEEQREQIYIDDESYVLESGTDGTNVNFIDSETIIVTTPPGKADDKGIIVINTDGGASKIYNGLTYILPIPESPTGFIATPGHERSIVLKWNETSGAHRYKIFGRIRTKDDYVFIGETTNTEYILKDLKEDTKYYFRLWALNEYGESLGYDYDDARTLKAKYDDGDDKYDQEETTETVVNYSNGAVTVDLPSKYSGSEYDIDLTGTKYNSYNKIQINIPISSIKNGKGGVYIQANDITMYVPMYNLMYSTYYNTSKNERDANVVITLSRLDNAEKSRLTKGLARNQEAKSKAYSVKLDLQKGRETEAIDIREGINLAIKIDGEGVSKNKLYLTRYSVEENKIKEYNYTITESYDIQNLKYIYYVSAQVSEDGKFIVIYKK